MRNLAHIEQVKAVHDIEGKDRIGVAEVLGWTVIVNKEDIKAGDKVVYVEIDSVLPEKPEFEFLRTKKFRIRTMKMAGCYSQGICFPLSILPDGEYEIGTDVTDILGIKQYSETMDIEPSLKEQNARGKKYPEFLMRYRWFRKLFLPKKEQRGFPSFVKKTDETRCENMPWILENKNPFCATEKIDGQSGTFFLKRTKSKVLFMKDKYEFGVCSRNIRLFKEDDSSYWSVARQYKIEEVLHNIIGNNEYVVIQGECVGTGIQKNKYHINGYDLFVFNVIYPTGRLNSIDAEKIIKSNGMKFVPIITSDYILPDTIDELRKFVHGQSVLYPTLREGMVFRSQDGLVSFKCVDPEFLLKHKE